MSIFCDAIRSDSAAPIDRLAACLHLGDVAARRHVAREPYVSTDSRPAPDCYAAQDGRAGVDDHVVFNDRVARNALDQHTVRADRKSLRAESDCPILAVSPMTTPVP